jgi:YidC/Oxa1 family membrane protein insertase
MGGCLLLLFQMPVFMGLYYALQESIFFRLDPFLWIPNLAAPDMLVYWTESIPFISEPGDLGSTLYLGPYFNLLPVLAVSLMLLQQIKTMPKSDDPQVQAQQRMMKFMMIIMAVFFYKMPAGLCLYFIASTLWGLTERNFLPKPKIPGETPPNNSGAINNSPPPEPKELGWVGRKKLEWKEKWKTVLEQAQKQQEYRRDPTPQLPDKGGKKKRKRK